MKKWHFCFTLIFCGFILPNGGAAPQAGHVVLISFDGLRPDAIDAAKAVTLLELIKQGAYCSRAKTVRPSLTLPAHASMLTGLEVSRHHVIWNDYKPGEISLPTIFSYAKQSGRRVEAFLSKPKFYFLAPARSLDFRYIPPAPENWDSTNPKMVRAGVLKSYLGPPDTSAQGIALAIAKEWPRQQRAFTFIHFREPDVVGHLDGWMSNEYLEAVGNCDKAVGSILETLDLSGARERTVVIVTSDHGGKGRYHLKDVPENNSIPWICAGPGVPKGLIIQRQVHIADTMPTVLTLLGIPVPEKLDGKVVREVIQQ